MLRRALLTCDDSGKDNGTKIQGWVGGWDETNNHQRWVFNQFSATGSRIKTILDAHPKIHGKVIVEWPQRMCVCISIPSLLLLIELP